ncbi:MAG: GIY-YIG nuclease family protein [Patescibacteria group bacterium]
MNTWFVYILLCRDTSLYTGASPDPEERFLTHQKGKGSKYTRSHPPLKLVYQEACGTHSNALKRELEIKSWSREKKITQLGLILT